MRQLTLKMFCLFLLTGFITSSYSQTNKKDLSRNKKEVREFQQLRKQLNTAFETGNKFKIDSLIIIVTKVMEREVNEGKAKISDGNKLASQQKLSRPELKTTVSRVNKQAEILEAFRFSKTVPTKDAKSMFADKKSLLEEFEQTMLKGLEESW